MDYMRSLKLDYKLKSLLAADNHGPWSRIPLRLSIDLDGHWQHEVSADGNFIFTASQAMGG